MSLTEWELHKVCTGSDWHCVKDSSWLWLFAFVQAQWILANGIWSTRRSQRNLIFSQVICLMHYCQNIVTVSGNLTFSKVTYCSFKGNNAALCNPNHLWTLKITVWGVCCTWRYVILSQLAESDEFQIHSGEVFSKFSPYITLCTHRKKEICLFMQKLLLSSLPLCSAWWSD